MRWGAAAVGVTLAALVAASLSLQSHTPATPEWILLGQLAHARSYATATALPNGDVLVAGGLDGGDPALPIDDTELIDARTGRVSILDGQIRGRLNHTATLLPTGEVYVIGGTAWRGQWEAVRLVDIFSSKTRRWRIGAPLPDPRHDHGAAVLADGSLFITGGNWGTRTLATSLRLTVNPSGWRSVAPMPYARTRFSLAPLPDGRLLVAGGLDHTGRPLATSLLYDPVADRWTSGPDLALPRVQHTTVPLATGDVLLIGGQDAAAGTAERYDMRLGAFVHAGVLWEPLLIVQAAALRDGRVIVTGGVIEKPWRAGWEPVGGAEIWDPLTNHWTALAMPILARARGELVPTPYGFLQLSGVGERATIRAIERLIFR